MQTLLPDYEDNTREMFYPRVQWRSQDFHKGVLVLAVTSFEKSRQAEKGLQRTSQGGFNPRTTSMNKKYMKTRETFFLSTAKGGLTPQPLPLATPLPGWSEISLFFSDSHMSAQHGAEVKMVYAMCLGSLYSAMLAAIESEAVVAVYQELGSL